MTEAEREALLRPVYRERARLAEFVASTHYGTTVMSKNDPAWPDFWVLYVHTLEGQVTWHIHELDADLFDWVEKVSGDHPWAQWDGHDTEEKYRRLERLGERARRSG